MKDCNGIELQVGDTVCYIGSGGLVKGKVVGTVRRTRVVHRYRSGARIPLVVETDRVEVERPHWAGDERTTRVNLTASSNVVKVPA